MYAYGRIKAGRELRHMKRRSCFHTGHLRVNKQLGNGLMAEAVEAYGKATAVGSRASDCVACKQCEKAYP